MPDLILPNAEAELVASLRERALALGVSIEEMHRLALRRGLAETPTAGGKPYAGLDFKEMLMAMPDVGRDEDFRIPRSSPRTIDT